MLMLNLYYIMMNIENQLLDRENIIHTNIYRNLFYHVWIERRKKILQDYQ